VLFPGAGSELYRGLGAVLLGGLLFATLVTLVLVPALLALCFRIVPPQRQATRSDSAAAVPSDADAAPVAAGM
jgi:HAE1 family hydrophobic/amphiphilic exporter-1